MRHVLAQARGGRRHLAPRDTCERCTKTCGRRTPPGARRNRPSSARSSAFAVKAASCTSRLVIGDVAFFCSHASMAERSYVYPSPPSTTGSDMRQRDRTQEREERLRALGACPLRASLRWPDGGRRRGALCAGDCGAQAGAATRRAAPGRSPSAASRNLQRAATASVATRSPRRRGQAAASTAARCAAPVRPGHGLALRELCLRFSRATGLARDGVVGLQPRAGDSASGKAATAARRTRRPPDRGERTWGTRGAGSCRPRAPRTLHPLHGAAEQLRREAPARGGGDDVRDDPLEAAPTKRACRSSKVFLCLRAVRPRTPRARHPVARGRWRCRSQRADDVGNARRSARRKEHRGQQAAGTRRPSQSCTKNHRLLSKGGLIPRQRPHRGNVLQHSRRTEPSRGFSGTTSSSASPATTCRAETRTRARGEKSTYMCMSVSAFFTTHCA